MSYNGSGTYIPPAGQPVATGTVIQSSTFNTLVTDIGNTLNNVLPRDGQASMSGQLKITDGTSGVPGIAFNSEASTGIFRPNAGALALVASGVENLRINSAGRVLIGTTADDGTNKLQVNGPVKVSGTLYAAGVTNTGNGVISGTLGVTGATSLTSVSTSGAATIGTTLGVTGATTLSSTLGVTGATSLSTVSTSGAATVGGTLGVTGATSLSSLSTSGAATVGTTLGVTGATSLSSVSTSGAATVGTTLGVTGATTLSSTLGVTGATSLSSVSTSGAASVGTTLSVTGNATVGGTLGVTGNTTVSGTLGVLPDAVIGAGNGYAGNTTAAANGVLKLYSSADGYTRLANGYASGGILLNAYNGYVKVDAQGNLGIKVSPSPWTTGAAVIQMGNYGAYGQARGGTCDTIMSWNASVASGAASGTGYAYRNTGDIASAYEQNGNHRWYVTPTAGTAGNAVSFNQAMTLDTSGNLMLGTTLSQGKLTALGTIASLSPSTSVVGQFASNNNGDIGITAYSATGAALAFGTSPSGAGVAERMRIDSTGNVGVGTNAPNVCLHVADGDIVCQKINGLSTGVKVGGMYVRGYTGYAAPMQAGIESWVPAGAAGIDFQDLRFFTVYGNPSSSSANGIQERMRIDHLGNVGINTTAPSARLDLGGSVASAAQAVLTRGTSDSNFQLTARNGSGATANSVQATFGMEYVGSGTAAGLSFMRGTGALDSTLQVITNNTERARVTATGNLLLGTTTDNGAKLQVNGTSTFGSQAVFAEGTATLPGITFANDGGNDTGFEPPRIL